MGSAFVAIVKDEGVLGLFKGMMPNYAKVVPAGMLGSACMRRGRDHPRSRYFFLRVRRAEAADECKGRQGALTITVNHFDNSRCVNE